MLQRLATTCPAAELPNGSAQVADQHGKTREREYDVSRGRLHAREQAEPTPSLWRCRPCQRNGVSEVDGRGVRDII